MTNGLDMWVPTCSCQGEDNLVPLIVVAAGVAGLHFVGVWLRKRGPKPMKSIKNVAIVVLLVVAVGIVLAVKLRQPRPAAERPQPPADAAPSVAAPANRPAAGPRLVDLGAGKCIPCKMMAPILEELKKTYEGKLGVEFIDVWLDPAAGREYAIRVIPTQIFLAPDGRELFRHEGFYSREDILKKWQELGYVFEERAEVK